NDLMNFFKQMGGNGEVQAQNDLFSFMESNSGKELLQNFSFDGENFVSPKGETISPQDMMAKVEKMAEGELSKSGSNKDILLGENKLLNGELGKKPKNQTLKTSEDFLTQRKTLNNTSAIDGNNIQEGMKKTHPSMNTYMKSSNTFKKQFIEAKPNEPIVKKSSEFSKTSELVDGFDSLKTDQNLMGLESTMSKNVDGNEVSMSSGETKVLDLSNISATNKTQLINKLSNYIEQSYVAGKDSVEMVVNHEELGQFKIMANKAGPGNQINLEINTLTEKGQQFFVENESQMIRTLTESGIKISDVKIIPGSDIMLAGEGKSSGSESFSQSQGRGESGQYNQSSRQFGDGQNGEDKRRQLWKNAQEYQQYLSA
ncbi:MAG: hypothetical protein NXH75_07795, partial [Halobacteriovoraceae bacterium]|nr:hypothetical protein [Halobacteriovoraceae bacterium]